MSNYLYIGSYKGNRSNKQLIHRKLLKKKPRHTQTHQKPYRLNLSTKKAMEDYQKNVLYLSRLLPTSYPKRKSPWPFEHNTHHQNQLSLGPTVDPKKQARKNKSGKQPERSYWKVSQAMSPSTIKPFHNSIKLKYKPSEKSMIILNNHKRKEKAYMIKEIFINSCLNDLLLFARPQQEKGSQTFPISKLVHLALSKDYTSKKKHGQEIYCLSQIYKK